jgi:molybdopterin-guanine dinucleotide biosynthesis protein A
MTVRQSAGAIVLAGGRGSRLSRDKGCLLVGGVPIVARVVAAARTACVRVMVVGDAPLPGGLDATVVADATPGGGPVQALGTGLGALGTPLGVLLAWDMPFVSVKLLRYLVANADAVEAVVPRIGGRPQPLCAVYAGACLPVIETLDEGRNAAMGEFLARLRVRWVEEDEVRPFGDSARLFLNVNTDEDLAKARAMAYEGDG